MKKQKNRKAPIVILIMIICFVMYLRSGVDPGQVEGGVLVGEAAGGEKRDYTITASLGDYSVENIEVTVEPAGYTDAECEEMYNDIKNLILDMLFPEGQTEELITKDLNFYTELDGYPFEFEWNPSDLTLINEEGLIQTDEPFDTNIELHISYKSFEKDLSIPIHVVADSDTIKRLKTTMLAYQIALSTGGSTNAMMTENGTSVIKLPDSVDGEKVTYFFAGEKRNITFLIMGPVLSMIILICFRYDEAKEKKNRERKILFEYPGMLQKMSLYLSSGMTIRNIWQMLSREDSTGSSLYEEMRRTSNEIDTGVSESLAYYNFGKRLAIPEITRFTALLSQNLKKGSTSLGRLLGEEASQAFENKKHLARKAGEEAGTKLLFPMMILLADVLIMIMLPAFWNL